MVEPTGFITTTGDTRQVRRLKRKASWTSSLVYSTIITLFVGLALAIGGIAYVASNNKVLCPLLNELNSFYQDSPPDPKKMTQDQYQRAMRIGQIYEDMREHYGC